MNFTVGIVSRLIYQIQTGFKSCITGKGSSQAVIIWFFFPIYGYKGKYRDWKYHKPVKDLKTAKGEAFLLSGRAFDEMSKTGKRLKIQSANEAMNLGLKIIANYADSLFSQLTIKTGCRSFRAFDGPQPG